MDNENEITVGQSSPESEEFSATEALRELSELAKAETEQWDYMPKPPRRLRKKDYLFIKVFFSMLAVFIVLFSVCARRVFGKGWLKNMITGEKPGQHFTLPIADIPKLDGRFYQPDGRFTVEGVYEAVSPSIVTVTSYSDDSVFEGYGQGSGIIMSSDGYILTNAHVVLNSDLALKVRTKDGEEYNAKIIGSDLRSDIAVIKIEASGLPAAQFGDSDAVMPGEQVVAIGTPAGFEGSVTAGVVSGVDRMIKVESTNIDMSCIQIDAAINPGNSGGALLNMWGQVIGMTSSRLDIGEFSNIGFAIEISAAQPIIEQLIENGRVLGRPRVGISFYEISDTIAELYGTPAGLEIAEISEDCDIANTELQVGDYIVEINGQKVRSADDVYAIILDMKPGDELTAKVVRVLPPKAADDGPRTREFEISFRLMEDNSEFVEESEDVEDEQPEEEPQEEYTAPEDE